MLGDLIIRTDNKIPRHCGSFDYGTEQEVIARSGDRLVLYCPSCTYYDAKTRQNRTAAAQYYLVQLSGDADVVEGTGAELFLEDQVQVLERHSPGRDWRRIRRELANKLGDVAA